MPVVASIQKRTYADGRVVYRVLFRHRGVQTSLSYVTEKAATKAKKLIEALGPDEAVPRLQDKPASATQIPTVAAWLDRHIADLTGITDRTRSDYQRLSALHITTHLGALDVDEVTTSDIARWANALEGRLSGKSIGNLRALLSSAFGYAVEQGHRRDNPMGRLRRSRSREHEREEMICLTPQEFGRLRGLLPERWRPFATVLVGTGMRFGEAVAMEVGDVDLLAPTPVIRITKALRRTPGGVEVGPPKTRRSRRTISLSNDLVDVLAPLVTRDRGELLFHGRDGARVHHGNFYNRIWRPAADRLAEETGRRPRIHDLRHSHASWLIAAGVPLPVIRDRLGHESISTTVDVYGHLLPDQHRQTAAALDGLLADQTIS
jgi:integrase